MLIFIFLSSFFFCIFLCWRTEWTIRM